MYIIIDLVAMTKTRYKPAIFPGVSTLYSTTSTGGGVVLIHVDKEGNQQVLIIENKPMKTLGFPKGRREFTDNTIVDTMIRELFEETGVKVPREIAMKASKISSSKQSYAIVYCYGDKPTVKICPKEINSYRWVDYRVVETLHPMPKPTVSVWSILRPLLGKKYIYVAAVNRLSQEFLAENTSIGPTFISRHGKPQSPINLFPLKHNVLNWNIISQDINTVVVCVVVDNSFTENSRIGLYNYHDINNPYSCHSQASPLTTYSRKQEYVF